MKQIHRSYLLLFPAIILGVCTAFCPGAAQDSSRRYFKIRVVDDSTGRGVPLVELRTVNNIRCYTDSNGFVAFDEPGLMDTEVFFFVDSHGYEFPKDGFGYRGTRLKTTPGGGATIEIRRLNIAERLYRVTGQGIYRDSILTGEPVPLKNPVINGLVLGQDSVYTCVYHGRLFWLWGDTNRASYPLGHFATAGAFSDLPDNGGLDPAVGVNLEYFVDETGFSRPICRLKEKGLVWLDGLLTVTDKEGRRCMVAKHARMKSLGTALERGLVVFNDETESFEPLVRSGPDFLPYNNSGHALAVDVEGERYYYFATQFPLSVRMRVKADWDHVIDPNRYEVLTALPRPSFASWIAAGELTGNDGSRMPALIESLEKEKKGTHLYDITSGRKVTPHGGSVYYNAYRDRWISIFVESGGESSYLGEVWYAEADTPVGPWSYARKIVTHNKYTFYNPMQHPYFDKDGGRVIYFEGTYSNSFSGSKENPTPRYDYNQIMYRLSLDDSRLVMPVPVYEIHGEDGRTQYLVREGMEKESMWDRIESVPFCTIEPDRFRETGIPLGTPYGGAKAHPTIAPIYVQEGRLILEHPDDSSKPCFYVLPSDSTDDNSCVVSLYEYHSTATGRYRYRTDPGWRQKGWMRAGTPLCKVWKSPPAPQLIDRKAKPAAGR